MRLLFILIFINSVSFAGNFNSNASGAWSSSTSWTLTSGTDADGVPDADDNVTILNTHTITLTQTTTYCKSLTINAGGTFKGNSKKFGCKGNFTNNGNVTTNLQLYMQFAGATFTSSTPYMSSGDWYIQKTCTIASGTIVNKRDAIRIQNTGTKVVNFGNVTLRNPSVSSLTGRIICNGSNQWINKSGSSLTLNANSTGLTAANFICTEATNTVTLAQNNPIIHNTTYYNLNLTAVSSKTITGNITVLNDFFMNGAMFSDGITPAKLTVGGDLTANGSLAFTNTDDTLKFDGTSATTQTVSGTASHSIYNLAINNTGGAGVVFNSNVKVTNDLVMVSGNCNSGSSKLTLFSDANASARIAPITNTASVSFSGTMVIQKFIDEMGASYFDLSSPTQNSTVNDWDNEIYISGIGPYDGVGGPAGVDGDVFNGAASMNTYDETINDFVPVTGSSTALSPGTGYNLLLGDDSGPTTWFAKTIDTRGIPNYGDISLTGLTRTAGAGLGWHLVGNPYACHIDYANVTKLRMTNNIYYTNGGLYSDYVADFGTVLPPYQGFYVETNTSALAHSITFVESCKEDNHTTEFHRTKNLNDIKLVIHSSIVPYSAENNIKFTEKTSSKFDVDIDASYRKFPIPVSPALYMMDKTANKSMITNYMDNTSDEVTIPLGIFTPKTGVYYLDVNVANANGYNSIWIENTKTGNQYDAGTSVAVLGEELGTNTDFVLRMSKKDSNQSLLVTDNNLLIFNTENILNLKSTKEQQTVNSIEIFDMAGKKVFTYSNALVNTSTPTKLDISTLQNGIYIVNVICQNGEVINKKIIK